MDIFCIRGGTPLHGRIALHGAKNAALPLLAATLATGARCELLDCPDISDVTAACAILRHLGCAVEQHGGIVASMPAPHAGQIFRQNSCGKCALPSCSSGRCSRASARRS